MNMDSLPRAPMAWEGIVISIFDALLEGEVATLLVAPINTLGANYKSRCAEANQLSKGAFPMY